MNTRKTPRPSPKSFYLGTRDDAERRMRRLEEIAERHGMTRSQMLQAIADGDLMVIRANATTEGRT